MRHTAMYLRVSSVGQDMNAQEPELERWAKAQDGPIKRYRDKFTGKTMDRPGWRDLAAALARGEVSRVVVWRLDRLGRTSSGLTALFDDLRARGVGLVSLREGLDLSTPAGRMLAGVLASVAQYENEVRAERQRAGIEAKRNPQTKKCPWGGSRKGRRIRLTRAKERTILRNHQAGESIASIARTVGLSRQTVYRTLRRRRVRI